MIPILQWDPMPGAVSYDVHLICSGQGSSCTDGTQHPVHGRADC